MGGTSQFKVSGTDYVIGVVVDTTVWKESYKIQAGIPKSYQELSNTSSQLTHLVIFNYSNGCILHFKNSLL